MNIYKKKRQNLTINIKEQIIWLKVMVTKGIYNSKYKEVAWLGFGCGQERHRWEFPNIQVSFKPQIKTKKDQQYNYNGEVSNNSLETP